MRKQGLFFLILLLLCLSGYGQSRERLIAREKVFQGDMTIKAFGVGIWQTVGNLQMPSRLLASGSEGSSLKFRFHILYIAENPSEPFILQTRLLLSAAERPTMRLGLDKGGSGSRSAYTDWLHSDMLQTSGGKFFPVAVNVQQRNKDAGVDIRLQLIEIEIWEETPLSAAGEQTKVASIGSGSGMLPPQRPESLPTPPDESEVYLENPKETALSTGLAFLKASAAGNMAEARSYLAANVLSMTDFEIISAANIPFFRPKAGQSFEDYVQNYEPEIFSYAEFEGLFDDWERYVINGWQVSGKSYLFIGHQTKPWGKDIFEGQPLVFILEEENGRMKIKAFP
jgi:hypothetical protein